MSERTAPVDTLILLPGMDGTGELFSRFVRALGPGVDARVLRYPADRPLGYAELVKWVSERLPPERPYVLLAESFSGPVGIELAARAPGGLAALVLCCTFASNPRPALRRLAALLPVLPLGVLPVAPLARLLMGRHFERALQADLAAALRQVPAPVLRSRLRAVLDVDVSHRLRDVACPVLCLRAGQDAVVPGSAAELMHRIKPDLRRAELPGPHFLLQTMVKEAADQVLGFMRGLDLGDLRKP